MRAPRKTPLDPAQHCRHATHDKPLVRACWYMDRGNPCPFCARMEQETRAFTEAREALLSRETYYEYIRRTDRPGNSAGTFPCWAADLYEQAGKDVERAVALIADSGAYPEDVPLIEAYVRFMPELARDSDARWCELLDRLGITGRNEARHV